MKQTEIDEGIRTYVAQRIAITSVFIVGLGTLAIAAYTIRRAIFLGVL